MKLIQQADPKARQKAIWVICVATVLGLAAILAFEYVRDDFQSWLEQHFEFLLEHPLVVLVVSLVLVSPVLAAGTWTHRRDAAIGPNRLFSAASMLPFSLSPRALLR